jgi:hypothetical protein
VFPNTDLKNAHPPKSAGGLRFFAIPDFALNPNPPFLKSALVLCPGNKLQNAAHGLIRHRSLADKSADSLWRVAPACDHFGDAPCNRAESKELDLAFARDSDSF